MAPSKRLVLACGSGRRDRAATGFWVLATAASASSSFPHQAARVLRCCRRSHLAGGWPQRLRFVGPQCVAPVMGCTATFSAHNNMNDCPDLAVFSGLFGHPVERGGRRPRWRAPGAVGALDARASHCQRPAAWPAWTPSG